ncbi:hypothetical protein [Streptomyces lanatus]|uniref:Uncharacterized protein n=1 Tax=Streptomyces lanatus TaxID=66900 RepID=A0ABV1Y020_9ACTN|nr:hypothetical protein [Streptomyces lanatus]GHH22360.1 hypothetical protein GCM10018780_70760 [Streptomyces lanatus]
MSPAPAPEQASAEEEKFNPRDFPQKLRDAQHRAAELYAELHALQARLPWSREPHDGWPEVTDRGREQAGREASPGWDPADAEAYDKLWEELREATAAVQTHGWWKTCRDHGVQGADLVAVRQALKTANGAVPLARDDVGTAA